MIREGVIMNKTLLLYANDNEQSQEIKQEILEKIEGTYLTLAPYGQAPDFILTIGGDGTLLSAFHEYQDFIDTSRFVGIHTGHLGFYTDWRPHEIDKLIEGLLESDGAKASYPLIEIEITDTQDRKLKLLALNECSVTKRAGTMVVDVTIRDYFFETFRGNGMCISSPTGSTGLNKSLGGAIIHPRVEALQLTEMAGINNRVYRTVTSPMIVPRDEWIELGFKSFEGEPIIQIDHIYLKDIKVKTVRAQIAEQKINFACFRHTHFWDRVENAFLGNKKSYNRKDL